MGAGLVGAQHGVQSFDGDDVFQTEAGDQALAAIQQAVFAAVEDRVGVSGVAVRAFGHDFRGRAPSTDIGPACGHRDAAARDAGCSLPGEFFDDFVVGGIRRAGGKGGAVDAYEVGIDAAVFERVATGGRHPRLQGRKGLDPDRGSHRMQTAVPQVLSQGDVFPSSLRVWFFDEGGDFERA